MGKLTHNELIIFLLSISAMLIISRIFAEIGKRYGLPVVIGELIVGIILGPTILGNIHPELFNFLFPLSGSVSVALDGLISLSVIMLLFVVGMEVQLPLLLKQGKPAVYTGFFSMLVPFSLGFGVAWIFPEIFLISSDTNSKLGFALFLGTALSMSALPVIARILMDMNLFRTNIGMIIIASAMFNDLIGWLIFSVVLGISNTSEEHLSIGYTIIYIIGFGIFMLTIGKKIIDKTLPWMQTKLSWPGGVLSISLGICLLSAAFTESINIHAILGAFIAGIAFGDSVQLKEQAREIIHQFITNFFAPLFFVSIGLKVNFIANFDFVIVSILLILSFIGKVGGSSFGARLGGINKRDSLAIGFGLNTHGAIEIILGTLALNAGLISETIFVAIIMMVFITSLTSSSLMRRFIN